MVRRPKIKGADSSGGFFFVFSGTHCKEETAELSGPALGRAECYEDAALIVLLCLFMLAGVCPRLAPRARHHASSFQRGNLAYSFSTGKSFLHGNLPVTDSSAASTYRAYAYTRSKPLRRTASVLASLPRCRGNFQRDRRWPRPLGTDRRILHFHTSILSELDLAVLDER